ncbi:MAG TPA: OmpA family protein, partial [Candidatus Acidoferrales bacterium]|nr:OmpA family protein [Candidatus Acidoferrales bacterium]
RGGLMHTGQATSKTAGGPAGAEQAEPDAGGNLAMKTRTIFALPLAAALLLPAAAQQTSNPDPSQTAQPQATQSAPTDVQAQTNADLGPHQPLEPQTRQGFWGKLNPFARKKYVEKQLAPVRSRVNELDELSAANSKNLKDLDARSTAALRQANDRANLADQHATDATNRAQMANQTAQQASSHLQNVQQVVGNLDQYQQSNQVEIRFRPGVTQLSKKAKDAIDEMAANLKDQRGYVIEVQGFAPGRGQAAIAQSKSEADAVVRYLVLEHQIPVYRIFELGMGSARPVSADEEGAKTSSRVTSRVEVTLLKNGIDQLGTQQASAPGAMSAPQQYDQQNQNAPQYAQPSNPR